MGQLTFQATLGGAVNLAGPNTASTTTFTLPSADGSANQPLTTNGSGTLAFQTLPVAGGGTGATSLTANNVLLGNGTSAFQTVAPGTSGNILTSNGTTWASTAPSASSSGLTLVQTINASTGSVIVNGFSSTYDNYKLIITDIYNSTNNNYNLEMQFYIGGTLITASTYAYANTWINSSSTANDIGATANDTIRLANALGNTGFNPSNYFEVDFFAVNGASSYKSVMYNGVYHYSDITNRLMGGGTQTGTSGVLTGAKIFFTGGTMSGKFQLYGYAKT